MKYAVNEMFVSLQGEGVRAGTLNVFVRFTGCNLRCSHEAGPKSPGGFDCDTEFSSGRALDADEIVAEVLRLWPVPVLPPSVILTGGEPGLQANDLLLTRLREARCFVAIETNGSVELPHAGDPLRRESYALFDWITVSPKVAEHCVRQPVADEVKYVRGHGQGIPAPTCKATHRVLSPAFAGADIDREALLWCVRLVHENPAWRLSVQQHKLWRVR